MSLDLSTLGHCTGKRHRFWLAGLRAVDVQCAHARRRSRPQKAPALCTVRFSIARARLHIEDCGVGALCLELGQVGAECLLALQNRQGRAGLRHLSATEVRVLLLARCPTISTDWYGISAYRPTDCVRRQLTSAAVPRQRREQKARSPRALKHLEEATEHMLERRASLRDPHLPIPRETAPLCWQLVSRWWTVFFVGQHQIVLASRRRH